MHFFYILLLLIITFTKFQFLTKYKNFKADNKDVEVSHLNINSKTLVEEAVRDSKTVVYFSHDYYSNLQDKNQQLVEAAEIANAYGVNKFIAVTPIENINYLQQDKNDDCIKEFDETISKTLEINPNSIILKSDVVFGMNSYFLKYLKQSWALAYNAIEGDKYRHHKYNPM